MTFSHLLKDAIAFKGKSDVAKKDTQLLDDINLRVTLENPRLTKEAKVNVLMREMNVKAVQMMSKATVKRVAKEVLTKLPQ